MDREKEMQEMAQFLCLYFRKNRELCNDCALQTEEEKCFYALICRILYNAGYRKAYRVREETTKAILKEVGDKVTYYKGEGSVFYERKPEWYYELCKKFGYKAE